MRATGWFLLGAFLLGCDPPRAAERTATRERAPAIVAFQSDSQGEEIRDIAVGSRIWAVNRTAPALARYSRDGRLEWHGLEQGEGPDQVSTAWSVVAIGDTAFVWDPRARRLARVVDGRVAPEATFGFATTRVISEPAHGINFGHPGRLRPYRSGWVTYATEERQSQAADLTPIVLLHFDRAGQVIDTLADLRSPSRPADRGAEGGNGPKELVPMPLWDVCQGERLVFFDPKGPLLWWDRLGGGGRDSLHFDFVPGPIPESFLRAHMYWQLQVAAQGRISEDTLRSWLDLSLHQRGSIFGKVAPYAVKLFCDGTDRAWLERFDLEAPPRGLGRTWLVIDLATKTVREARVPPGFQALAADSLTLYGTVVDGGGVSAVATVEIGSVMR